MRPSNVTIIIPTCNRAHYLGETLDSVLGQTVPPTQVIVVNDGSTNSTLEVLGRYSERIEVIDQENGGRARAVNRAMARVRGEYLWIFDDDDIAVPQNLERHLAVLEAHPEVGLHLRRLRDHPEPSGRSRRAQGPPADAGRARGRDLLPHARAELHAAAGHARAHALLPGDRPVRSPSQPLRRLRHQPASDAALRRQAPRYAEFPVPPARRPARSARRPVPGRTPQPLLGQGEPRHPPAPAWRTRARRVPPAQPRCGSSSTGLAAAAPCCSAPA